MATRYFTSDLHFGSAVLLDASVMGSNVRPFSSLDEMHSHLIAAISKMKKDDTLIHLGDLMCIGNDRGYDGLTKHEARQIINSIACNKVFIAGNHDASNAIYPCAGRLLVDCVGEYHITLQHYPSNHHMYIHMDLPGLLYDHGYKIHINICGHVHKAWKVFYDDIRHVLNINIGIDYHKKYVPYSEQELIHLIQRAIAYFKFIVSHRDAYVSYAEWDLAKTDDKATKQHEKRISSAMWKLKNKPELMTEVDWKLISQKSKNLI